MAPCVSSTVPTPFGGPGKASTTSGFTLDALTERLGVHAFAHLAQGELAPLVRATRAGDRLDTVLRLFVVGLPVSLAEAQAALAPLPVEQWIAGGVLDRRRPRRVESDRDPPARWPDELVGRPRLRPAPRGRRSLTDHVLGMSASTHGAGGRHDPPRDLQRLRPRHRLRRAGPATHRRTAARVVASDLNPRATRVRHPDHGAQRRHQRRRPRRQTCSTRSRASAST